MIKDLILYIISYWKYFSNKIKFMFSYWL